MDKKQVHGLMVDDLQRSGLTEKDIKLLHLNSGPHTLIPAAAGYTIPYFDPTGMLTEFYRVKYVEPTLVGFAAMTGAKQQKYSQPTNTVNELYMPPYIDWEEFLTGDKPLIITEGEKKSAIATKKGLPCVGLGGVWCFMSKKNKLPLLPIFDYINLKNRTVYICFDSDASANPNILMAEGTLARRLLERGAVVLISRIPPDGSNKVGIDDYLVKHSPDDFINRVLNNSFDYSESAVLHDMNGKLVYLRSIGTIYDYEHKMRISSTAFTQHSHSNVWIDVPTINAQNVTRLVRKSAAKVWLEWEHRAELEGITYAPGEAPITDSGMLNMWKGWGVKSAEPGSVELWTQLLDMLFAGASTKARQWFERWCAYPIQHPGYKMASAVVFWGAETGTGKSTIGYTLMKLYGDNAIEVKDANLQNVRFEWAENKQFVLGDDITGHDNRKLANVFKTMITQKTIYVDPKFVQPYSIPDRINYYFTSNDPDAFYLSDNDRRFFVHEVVSDKMTPEFSKAYMKWMNSAEGMSHLFHYFLNLDLGDFDPQAEAMVTDAKHDMTHISKSELGAWVSELKENPTRILNGKTKRDLFTAEELHVLFDPAGDKRASPNSVARELKRSGMLKIQQPGGGAIYVHGSVRARLYAVRNVEHWKHASAAEAATHYMEADKVEKKGKKY